MANALRYLAAGLVIVIGIATIIGSISITDEGWDTGDPFPLRATANSPSDVWLEWDSPCFDLSYRGYCDVIRSEGSITVTFQTAQSYFLDQWVQPDTAYCYRVHVLGDTGNIFSVSTQECITTPGTAGWAIETIDDGSNPALALDASNQPHVSYRNSQGVMLAYKSGTSWQQSIVDSGAGSEGDTDVVIDPSSADQLSYADATNDLLLHASNGTGVWRIQAVDTAVGGVNALSVDSAGNAHMVYNNNDVTDLGVVNYATNASGSWQTERLAEFSNGSIRDADILVDAAGAVHLVFTSGVYGGSVHYMTNQSGTWQRQVVDDSTRCGVEMAMDTAGNVHVVYVGRLANNDLALMHTDNSGGIWQSEQIDSRPSIECPEVSLAIDGADRLHIAYRDRYDNLKYVTNVRGMWELSFLDSYSHRIFGDPAIAVDPVGRVTVVYTESTNGIIKLVASP